MTFLITQLITDQGAGLKVETRTQVRLWKAATRLLLGGLGPGLLIFLAVRHADSGTIRHDHASALQAFFGISLRQLLRRMAENAFQVGLLKFLTRLTITGGGRRRLRHRPRGGKRMEFTDHLRAATIRIQYLDKKTPERVFLTEQSSSTLCARSMRLEHLIGNKMGEARCQLTDRFAAYFSELIGQPLACRSGPSAQSGQVKTRKIQSNIFHAQLSHLGHFSAQVLPC